MSFCKPCYCSIYKFNLKLLLLIVAGIVVTNCTQPKAPQILTVRNPNSISESAVNINTAAAEELEKLPRIGAETAKRIIEFREKYGRFRRPENLILVHGMSDKKFRDLRNLVKVE